MMMMMAGPVVDLYATERRPMMVIVYASCECEWRICIMACGIGTSLFSSSRSSLVHGHGPTRKKKDIKKYIFSLSHDHWLLFRLLSAALLRDIIKSCSIFSGERFISLDEYSVIFYHHYQHSVFMLK